MKILHASKIGFRCLRALWYSCNGYKGEVSQHSQRIFEVGNTLEPMVARWLQEDGWDVDYNPGSQDAKVTVTVQVKGGEIVGHYDCFISKGEKQNILIDIKTMNDRAFKLWKQQGTLTQYPQYVDQLHVYARGCINAGRKVYGLGVVGINKNNSDMHIDFFDFDPAKANLIELKAESIFSMSKPPEGDMCPMSEWACGYCEFAGLCELCQKKRSTDIGSDVVATDDAEIIDAMKLLQDARDMSKEAKDMEAEAKSVIDAKFQQLNLKSVTGGGYTLTLKESIRNTFDSTAFKKAHPEMISDFMKQTKSLTYELKERR